MIQDNDEEIWPLIDPRQPHSGQQKNQKKFIKW